MDNTYNVSARCSNCGWTGELAQSKGVPLSTSLCPRCGCQGHLGASPVASSLNLGEAGKNSKKTLLRG